MLGSWWVWAIGAIVLAFLEVVVPAYVFLGFAIGAGATALILLVGGPVGLYLATSMPLLLLFFAIVSLIGWLALRRWLGVRAGQVKEFDRDINED